MLEHLRTNRSTQLALRRLLSVALVSLLAVTPGCAHRLSKVFSRLGVGYSSTGDLSLYYLSCEAEEVTSLTLYLLDGDNVAPDDGDEIVWQAPLPISERVYSVPHELTEPLATEEAELLFVVETSLGGGDSDSFKLDQIGEGYIRTGTKKSLSQEEFARSAATTCG